MARTRFKPLTLLTLLLSAGLAAAPIPSWQRAAQAKAVVQDHGFDLSNLDQSVKPNVDFYRYAVGGWMAKHPIPPEYAEWGSFRQLADSNQAALRTILERAAKDRAAKAGSNEQKIGDFYASFMDADRIEAAGLKPLQGEFDRIDAIHDQASLLDAIADLQSVGVKALFEFGSTQDFKDSTQMIGEADQGGLGLPDRDYYTRDDAHSQDLRTAYVKHVAKTFELAGASAEAAARQAQVVMDLETSLAKASMTKVQRRDPDAVYHKKTLAQLHEMAPNVDWVQYFTAVGRPDVAGINVAQPDFFKAADGLLGKVSLSDWKTYLRWHLLDGTASALPDAFVQEDFAFGRQLSGAKVLRPRWKRGVQAVDSNLGDALGQLYVHDYFPPSAKARVEHMVHGLIATLHDDLRTLDWMSPATRKAATTKLAAIRIKIGYPSKWKDYSALQVDRGAYAANLLRARQFATKRDLAKIGKPVDPTEWGMTPPTVNAYYDGTMNEIVFPAGILQPPFFNPKADDAVNYGGIGVVIGHEITHGFDDQGCKFDAMGNLRNWWTPEDKKRFDARANGIIEQFDGYYVEKDLHENGKLVVGESIADLGGLTIAYKTLETSMAGHKRQLIDGFTPEQRFFLGYAQVWASNIRPEFARMLVNTNPHPLARFRVNGPLSNLSTFAKAFGAKKGDPMVREKACQIW